MSSKLELVPDDPLPADFMAAVAALDEIDKSKRELRALLRIFSGGPQREEAVAE